MLLAKKNRPAIFAQIDHNQKLYKLSKNTYNTRASGTITYSYLQGVPHGNVIWIKVLDSRDLIIVPLFLVFMHAEKICIF